MLGLLAEVSNIYCPPINNLPDLLNLLFTNLPTDTIYFLWALIANWLYSIPENDLPSKIFSSTNLPAPNHAFLSHCLPPYPFSLNHFLLSLPIHLLATEPIQIVYAYFDLIKKNAVSKKQTLTLYTA